MAGLAEQLKAVKLHKGDEPMKDFSSPKTAGFISDQEVKKEKKKSFHYIVCATNSSTASDVLLLYPLS